MKKKSAFILSTTLLLTLIPNISKANSSPKIYIDNKEIYSDVPPIIENGRTLVPIRFISEGLGANVKWNENFQNIQISKNSVNSLNLYVGQNYTVSNEYTTLLDTAPKIINNRTYVPLRFIAENFDLIEDNNFSTGISWNDNTKSVYLYSDINNSNLKENDKFLIQIEKVNTLVNEFINGFEREFINSSYLSTVSQPDAMANHLKTRVDFILNDITIPDNMKNNYSQYKIQIDDLIMKLIQYSNTYNDKANDNSGDKTHFPFNQKQYDILVGESQDLKKDFEKLNNTYSSFIKNNSSVQGSNINNNLYTVTNKNVLMPKKVAGIKQNNILYLPATFFAEFQDLELNKFGISDEAIIIENDVDYGEVIRLNSKISGYNRVSKYNPIKVSNQFYLPINYINDFFAMGYNLDLDNNTIDIYQLLNNTLVPDPSVYSDVNIKNKNEIETLKIFVNSMSEKRLSRANGLIYSLSTEGHTDLYNNAIASNVDLEYHSSLYPGELMSGTIIGTFTTIDALEYDRYLLFADYWNFPMSNNINVPTMYNTEFNNWKNSITILDQKCEDISKFAGNLKQNRISNDPSRYTYSQTLIDKVNSLQPYIDQVEKDLNILLNKLI